MRASVFSLHTLHASRASAMSSAYASFSPSLDWLLVKQAAACRAVQYSSRVGTFSILIIDKKQKPTNSSLFSLHPYPLPFFFVLLVQSTEPPVFLNSDAQAPLGHREVVETVILLLIGKVGLRFSKVRVSSSGGEALVPASSWNMSSLALPRLVGVLLQ
jgi:hypothetical protein